MNFQCLTVITPKNYKLKRSVGHDSCYLYVGSNTFAVVNANH